MTKDEALDQAFKGKCCCTHDLIHGFNAGFDAGFQRAGELLRSSECSGAVSVREEEVMDFEVALKHDIERLTGELDRLPWWRILRRFELVDQIQDAQRMLARLWGLK